MFCRLNLPPAFWVGDSIVYSFYSSIPSKRFLLYLFTLISSCVQVTLQPEYHSREIPTFWFFYSPGSTYASFSPIGILSMYKLQSRVISRTWFLMVTTKIGLFVFIMLQEGSDGVRFINVALELSISELSLLSIFWFKHRKGGLLLYSNYL